MFPFLESENSLEVNIFNEQNALPINHNAVTATANAVLLLEGKKFDEVSINFITTEAIQDLHLEFFDDATTTDCISFPMDDENSPGHRILGEIFVCPQTAIDYALSHNGDPNEELTLYIIHGLLHLLGYDDIDPKDRKIMRSAEKRHIKNLKEQQICL